MRKLKRSNSFQEVGNFVNEKYVVEQNKVGVLAVQFEKFMGDRVIRNSFYGVIQFFIPAVLLFGFTPFFIYRMGTENYGLWMLATSALGLMSIAEFGLNTAISKFVAEFVENKDDNALSTVVSVGLITYILLGIILTFPLYIFSPYLAGILKSSDTISIEQTRLVIQIMSLGFFPLLLRSGAMAIPIGLQRFRLPVIVTIGYQVINYSAALLVVFWGGTVAQVVTSTVAVLWVAALGSLVLAWKILQPFKIRLSIVHSGEILSKMRSFTLMSGVSGLGSQIFSFADRLAVGAVLGLDAVAYYSVIISIATKILQLSSALTSALMPAVSTWMAAGNIRQVRTYFWKATAALLVVNCMIAGILLAISAPFLRLWMGETFADHVLYPFRILIIIYALISLNAPAYYVAYGIGKPGINALAAIAGGCLVIGLIFAWGETMGLVGAAMANGGYLISWIIILYVYIHVKLAVDQVDFAAKQP